MNYVDEKETSYAIADPADDLELVAIITAALYANLATKTDQLVVRSIKRSEKWNRAF